MQKVQAMRKLFDEVVEAFDAGWNKVSPHIDLRNARILACALVLVTLVLALVFGSGWLWSTVALMFFVEFSRPLP